MTTPKTDAIMALADRYAFHIPGSQHSDEARAVLLAALQSAQPVAQPLTDEQIDAFWNQQLTVPQIVQRRVIARAIEAAHGIGGAL